MKIVHDDAVIIGFMDYRENDRIVTFFSREHGKISGIARGARKSVKRFGGALELFALLSIRYVPGEALVAISDVDIRTIYPRIRDSLAAIAHAGYAAELVAALAPERLPLPRVFRLLTSYLEHLDATAISPFDRHLFEVNLLNILGYRPPIECCASCGADLSLDGGIWSGRFGDGLCCRSCATAGMRLSAATVIMLRSALATGRFGRLCQSGDDLEETDRFLHDFIAGHLQRPLKSLAFLRLSP
jgi:DNA repair protein RecO (recombination protein O)